MRIVSGGVRTVCGILIADVRLIRVDRVLVGADRILVATDTNVDVTGHVHDMTCPWHQAGQAFGHRQGALRVDGFHGVDVMLHRAPSAVPRRPPPRMQSPFAH